MSDLISRSTATKNYCNALCPKLQKGEYCNDCIVKAWLNNQPTAYDIDKVIEELESELKKGNIAIDFGEFRLFEIVKHGGVDDDVCEWRLCDEEANVYDTSCRNSHILIEGTPKENNYEYCPYCGKKIKVVE